MEEPMEKDVGKPIVKEEEVTIKEGVALTDEDVRKKKFKRTLKGYLIITVALIIFSAIAWGIGSSGGSVRMEKVSIVGDEGYRMTGTMAVPVDVSSENPAPVVVSMHGAGCSSDTEIIHAIEYGRRGYVTICADTQHGGELDLNREETWPEIGMSWIDYALSQDWCNGEVIISGMSNGSGMVTQILMDPEYHDKINAAVNIVSYQGITEGMHGEYPYGVNNIAIEGGGDTDAEEYRADMARFLNMPDFQLNTIYGDFEDGSAIEAFCNDATHPFIYLHPDAYAAIFEFVGQSAPTGTTIAPEDSVYLWFYNIMFVCFVLFTCMLGSLAYLLSLTRSFYPVIHTRMAKDRTSTKPLSIVGIMVFEIIVGILAWFLVVAPMMIYADFTQALYPIFHAIFVAPAVTWVFVLAIINFIFFAIRNRKSKRGGVPLAAEDFGTGGPGEAKVLQWKRFGYAVFIGLVVIVYALVWADCMVKTTGFGYTLNSLGMLVRITPERLMYAIPYLIPLGIAVYSFNLNLCNTHKLPPLKNGIATYWRDYLINTLVILIPITVILVLYVGSQYAMQIGWTTPYLDLYSGQHPFSFFSFPVMILLSMGISTYLYRKTGNVVLGTIVTTLFLTMFTFSSVIFQPSHIW